MNSDGKAGSPKTAPKNRTAEISPARKAAFNVLLAVEREQSHSHSDDLLRGKAVSALSSPDRNLATALVLGVLRWQIQLDHQLQALLSRPNARLDSEILIALRLGAFQILHLEMCIRDSWEAKLPVEAGDPALHQAVTSPRPGHADLAGALKYNFPDGRYVLERASARETTARVAAGALAKLMLRTLDIEVASHVIRVGRVALDRAAAWGEIAVLAARDEVVLG